MDLCERLTMTDMRVPERRTFSQSQPTNVKQKRVKQQSVLT